MPPTTTTPGRRLPPPPPAEEPPRRTRRGEKMTVGRSLHIVIDSELYAAASRCAEEQDRTLTAFGDKALRAAVELHRRFSVGTVVPDRRGYRGPRPRKAAGRNFHIWISAELYEAISRCAENQADPKLRTLAAFGEGALRTAVAMHRRYPPPVI